MTATGETRTTSMRRVVVAGAIGALLAAMVFTAVLVDGRFTLFHGAPTASEFYDVQAESFLEGRWDVPREPLAIEGFRIDGKVYEYFGPVPALLRVPVVAITDDLNGELGPLSMLLAFGVAMLFTVRLLLRVRPLVRGDDPVTTIEAWATGAFTFVVGAGSVLVFLASRTWVFHEAVIWGVTWALGAFEFVIAVTLKPSTRNIVLAGVFTTLALLSRVSVGLGPLLALGAVGVAYLWTPTRRFVAGRDGENLRRVVPAFAVAVAVPLVLFAYVNYSKFGTLFSVPFDKQFLAEVSTNHKRALAANGGGMFGLQYLPTTLMSYFGPNGVVVSSLLPWVRFADQDAVIGDAVFAFRLPTASVPVSMPLLSILSLIGLFGAIRPGRMHRSLAALRAPLVGALVASVTTLAFAYVAHRYIADFLPALVLFAVAGLYMTIRSTAKWRSRPLVVLAWSGVAVLAVLSVWWNVGLAVLYQNRLEPGVASDRVASFVRAQYRVHDVLPGGAAPDVRRTETLPAARADLGDLVVIGDCDAVYTDVGARWLALERTKRAGSHPLRVRFPAEPTGWEPLVVGVDAQDFPVGVVTRVLPDDRVQFGLRGVFDSEPVRIDPAKVQDVEVVIDPNSSEYRLELNGETVQSMDAPNLYYDRPFTRLRDETVGSNKLLLGVAPEFTGSIKPAPDAGDFCRDVLG